MGQTVIVIDTNQFRHSPMLRSAKWTELFSKAADWGLRFVVPEVCFLEAVSVVRRKWAADRSAIAKLEIGEFNLTASQEEWLDAIDRRIASYEDDLQERLAEIGAEIVPIPENIGLLDIVKRAVERRAPYPPGDGTKDGFRDTLIWFTTCGIAAADPDCEVWLVSHNHNDFGEKSHPDKEACPFPLHQHLVEDLGVGDLADRVSYVCTIGRLAQHLAATYDALPDDERDALIEQVDRVGLTSRIEALLPQTPLDPTACALPVRTVTAAIQSLTADPDRLRLVDAARRGGGSWTAQYSQTVEAVVDLTDRDGDTSVQEKTLSVAGRLVVAADGSVTDVVVTSIEALSGDPMRRAWSQRTIRVNRMHLNTELLQNLNTGTQMREYLENLSTPNISAKFLQNLDIGTAPNISAKFLQNLDIGTAPNISAKFLEGLNLGTPPNLSAKFLENLDASTSSRQGNASEERKDPGPADPPDESADAE